MSLSAQTIPTEHVEQVTFVNEFRQKWPAVRIFAIPNGGFRHAATANKLKLEGVYPGVPDLYIPEWRMFVEMKRIKNGRLSKEQKDWIDYLENECGHTVIVGYGWEDAMKKLESFAN